MPGVSADAASSVKLRAGTGGNLMLKALPELKNRARLPAGLVAPSGSCTGIAAMSCAWGLVDIGILAGSVF